MMPTTIADEQLAEFRLKLRECRTARMREIRHKLQSTDNERYIDLVGSAHDVADESVADLLADLGILEIDRLVQEVNDIEIALLRIAHGTYGVCMDCGNGIAYHRLVAYPTAKRCQPCQMRYESSHAGAGHASL
jgi:RNA polymerase-binding transcription factor DksA